MSKIYKKIDGVRCTSAAIIIDFKDCSSMDQSRLSEKLYDYLEHDLYVKEFYYIFHDDTDIFHIHVVLMFTKQQYLKAWINKLSDLFQISEFAVQIQVLKHRNAMLRYIIHQSPQSIEDGKKAYDVNDIVSNINRQLLRCFIESTNEDKYLDAETLQFVCFQCDFDEIKIWEFLDTTLYKKHKDVVQLCCERRLYISGKYDKLTGDDLPF